MRTGSTSSNVSMAGRERSSSSASTNSNGSSGLPSPCLLLNNKVTSVCDIVKTGYLHVKRPPTSGSVKIRLKTWQKRYCVLRDQSYHKGSASLEVYSTDSGWQEDQLPGENCYNVDLISVTHVDEYTDSKSHPHSFTLTRTGHGPLILGTDTETDLKEWMVAIQLLSEKLKPDHHGTVERDSNNRDISPCRRPSCPSRIAPWGSASQLHAHDVMNNNKGGNLTLCVTDIKCDNNRRNSSGVRLLKIPNSIPVASDCLVNVISTVDSNRNDLEGEFEMIVLKDEIFLRRVRAIREVITWTISHIQKFKSEDESDGSNLVTLEASSQCGRAAGRYLFRTMFGRHLIQKVKTAISRRDIHSKHVDEELERLRARPLSKAPSTPNLLHRGSPPRLVARPSVPDVSQQSGPHLTVTGMTTYTDIDFEVPPSELDTTPTAESPPCPARVGDRIDQQNGSDPDVPREAPPRVPSIVPPDLRNNPPPEIPAKVPYKTITPPPRSPPALPSRHGKVNDVPVNSYLDLVVSESEHSPKTRLEHETVPTKPPHPEARSSPKIVHRSPHCPRRKLSKLPPLPPSAHERISPPKSDVIAVPPALPPRRASCSPPPPPPRPQHTLGSNSSII